MIVQQKRNVNFLLTATVHCCSPCVRWGRIALLLSMCNVGKNSVQWRERVSYMYTLFPLQDRYSENCKMFFPRPPSRKGGTGGGGSGHPQGDMHIVAARLGTMVGTRWANSCPGCMDRVRKYSHLVGGSSFLAGKAALALVGV